MYECLSLNFQKASNGLDSVATLEFDGERMLCQRDARFFFIRPQGRLEKLEKGLKASRFGLVSHITTRRRNGAFEEGNVLAATARNWVGSKYAQEA